MKEINKNYTYDQKYYEYIPVTILDNSDAEKEPKVPAVSFRAPKCDGHPEVIEYLNSRRK